MTICRWTILLQFLVAAVSCWGSCSSILKVPANAAKGFQSAYYLGIPGWVVTPAYLLVRPNASGSASNDLNVHDSAARSALDTLCADTQAAMLGSPILVPVFPRPTSAPFNPQTLGSAALASKLAGLERIDLQLIAMIDDAIVALAARGIQVDRRVFLYGFGNAGLFANRFLILHPDRIKAAYAGGHGFTTLPAAEWKGTSLPYPVGVSDLAQLTGKGFDATAFRSVPAMFFAGDADSTDPLDDTSAQLDLVRQLFGGPPSESFFRRWPKLEAAASAAGCKCQYIVYPGAGHSDSEFLPEIWVFFERYRTDPPLAPAPKPLLYRFFIPHMAVTDGWDTRIILLNRSVAPVNGRLTAYAARGAEPLHSIAVTLAAGERSQLSAAAGFADVSGAAYLVFESDSGFVNLRAEFLGPAGQRIPMTASRGAVSAEILNTAGSEWVALSLINAGDAADWVHAVAFAEDGSGTADWWLYLRPREKATIAMAGLAGTRRIHYTSSQRMVAFAMGLTADGATAEALPGLPSYLSP
jgi:dienelactone hydrolase